MQLYNQTQNIVLSKQLVRANSIPKRIKGLIFSQPKQALYLKTRWGIHTFMMRFSLTILICDFDSQNACFIIQKIKKHLKPGKLLFYNPAQYHIFELPDQSYTAKIGDRLIIKD